MKEKEEAEKRAASFAGWIEPSKLDQAVNEKAELINAAKEFRLDSAGKSAKEIKQAICKAVKRFDETRLDSDAAYLDAAWDQTKGTLKKQDGVTAQIITPFAPEKDGEKEYLS